jgi:hypothetical protein
MVNKNITQYDYKELSENIKTFDSPSFYQQLEDTILNNSQNISSSLNLKDESGLEPAYSALPPLEELNDNNRKFTNSFFSKNFEAQDKELLDIESFKPKAKKRYDMAMDDVSYIISITKNENDFISLMTNKESFEPKYKQELAERAQKDNVSTERLVKHLEISKGIYNYKMEQSLNLIAEGDGFPEKKSSEATIQKIATLLYNAELKEPERTSNYSEQIGKRDSYTNETLNEQASKRQRTI